jgi:TonB family protein
VAVFLVGWFTAGARSGIFGRFRKAKLEAVGTANAVESPPANSVASAPSPSVQNIPAQGDESEPLLPSAAGDFPGRQASNPRAEARSNEFSPASGNTSAVSSAVQIMRPQQHVLEPSSARRTTNELSPQAESASTPERLVAAAQPKETNVTAPPNPNADQPDGARAGSTGEQESSLPLKPAEDPEAAKTSISVSFSLYPSIQAPAGAKPQVSRQGAPLKIGQLLSRVDPVYPEDAEEQQIEGTVKLHAIIGPDGTIQSIGQTSGPALLVAAAENAVRRWLFTPSFVGGQPVPAEEDITITFQLLKKTAQN